MRVERRMTIDEISARLALPRTTIFYWVRDLTVPRSAFDQRPASEASKRAAQAKRRARLKREAAYAEGLESFDSLCALEPDFRDFVCLYLAEGHKRDRNSVSICNSDAAVMRLGNRWILRLASNPVDYTVQYHADQKPSQLRSFWGQELGIDEASFAYDGRPTAASSLSGRGDAATVC